MTLEINVNVPALDRLCNLIAAREFTDLATVIEERLKKATLAAGIQAEAEPETEAPADDAPFTVEPAEAQKIEPAPEPVPEPVPEPEPEPAAPALEPVKIEAIQRAAADLRDAGKLKAVTALFPAYSISKLSDLKPEQTGAFVEELKRLGAKGL